MTLRIENILLTVVWIALLIFVAWPLAMFLYPLYVILQPFAGIPGGLGDVIEEINGFLEKYVSYRNDRPIFLRFMASRL